MFLPGYLPFVTEEAPKKRRGRPPKDDKRDARVPIPVTPEEREAMSEVALADGFKSVAKWLRHLARKRAKYLKLEFPEE
mgnify:CR=1 FL=1